MEIADGTVMTTQGRRTIEELDFQLAAVQKLVRREKARKQKEEAYRNRSASNLHLLSTGNVSTPPLLAPHYVTLSNRRVVPRTSFVPAPVDRRRHTPSARIDNARESTSFVPKISVASPTPAPVSTSAVSAFMCDAESDFDKMS